MKEREEGRMAINRRTSGRRGMSSVTAAVVLIVAVGIVGAINYVVLNAIHLDHTSTKTVTSCAPSTAPQCREAGATALASDHLLMAVVSPV